MLRTRVLTALVLAPAVLAVDYFTFGWVFQLAVAALLLTGCWEFTRLANLTWPTAVTLFAIQASLIALMMLNWGTITAYAQPILLASGAAWCLMFLRLLTYRENQPVGGRYQSISFLAALAAISTSWYALCWLRELERGEFLIILLLFVIWAADVGAYFSGRFLGRTPLAPVISPKKTWEGVAGGIALAALATVVLGRFTPLETASVPGLVMLTAVTVMSSIGGDLYISVHKRSVKLKDAGHLFPGHGGVLDRFDSLLPGSVFFAIGVWYLGS